MPESAFLLEPFTIEASPEALADLRVRLRATRWPDAPADAGWSLGTDLAYLRDLVAYWADGFDWAAQEKALSEFPRFRARLDGLGIHYVHARAVNPAGPVLPLVLCHGWPDSFWRYTKVIPLLTTPGRMAATPQTRSTWSCPTCPATGTPTDQPAGRSTLSPSRACGPTVPDGLGYERFGAVGGDIGSSVSTYLALKLPERVAAVHHWTRGCRSTPGTPTT